jgi:hypothetical protein
MASIFLEVLDFYINAVSSHLARSIYLFYGHPSATVPFLVFDRRSILQAKPFYFSIFKSDLLRAMTSPGQMAVKGLAAGIGLISESISAHKARKQLSKNNTTDSTGLRASSEGNGHPQNHNECLEAPERGTIDSLEAQWELDETQDELEHAQGRQTELPEYSEGEQAVEEAVHRFASDYPPPVYTPSDATPTPQLRAPILLPQRRPKSRKRGFIRAYAPDLAAFSIDQPMFLEFLDTAEKACQGARWLNAINLASIGTMFMPTATGIAVSVAIQIATEVAIAVDGIRK